MKSMVLANFQILECNVVFSGYWEKIFHLFYFVDKDFFKKLPGEAGNIPLVLFISHCKAMFP